jgi:glycosyltransferase involved in cell wall biosynthesis
MKTILMIHAEGNLNVNPNLLGIVEILCESGYVIHYFCQQVPGVPQTAPYPNVRFIFIENGQLRIGGEKYAMVIGVDRSGIMAAATVARHLKIPHGLISYEIFFACETGDEFKQPEIAACTDLRFAVCQGNERSRQLAIENKISPDRIIDIPVAGRGIRRGNRNQTIHAALQLAPNKRIALYIGSIVSKWSLVDELVQNTREWGEDWVLVLHGRYNDDDMLRLRYRHQQIPRVYFTPQGALPPDQLQSLILGADIGIALYRPTFSDPHEGNNLKYLGLSSGKIATYLQHGLPVIVNDIGEMSDYVSEYSLGIHVHSLDELPARLQATDCATLDRSRENCFEFFERHMDLESKVGSLLEAINSCCNPS